MQLVANSDACQSIRSEWKVQVSWPSSLDSITSDGDVGTLAPVQSLRLRVTNVLGSVLIAKHVIK